MNQNASPLVQTAAQWTSMNPILDANQRGLESDTGKEKIGDGQQSWKSLSYMQLAAYVPSLGVAGPPATAGTTVGQAQIDVNGLMWVWNGTQWQLGGVGLELGYAETTVNYVLTTSFVAVPGLMVTATVPPGVDIRVEAEFPWVVNGSTGNNNTGMWMSLFEDAVLIGTAIAQYPIASTNSGAGVRKTYTPSSTGLHTYSVKVQQGASSAGATLEAGSQFGGLWNSSLRVVTV